MSERLISLSGTGRHVAIRTRDGLAIVDALDSTPRIPLAVRAADFACVGANLWVLRSDGLRLDRFALATGRPMGSLALAQPAALLCGGGDAVVVDGGMWGAHDRAAAPMLIHDGDVLPLDPELDAAFPLGGRRVAAITGARLVILDAGRRDPVVAEAHLAGTPVAVYALFGAHMVAVLAREGDADAWTVLDASGARVHRITAPRAASWAVASDAGVAIALADDGRAWSWIDLRDGTLRARGNAPWILDGIDLSSDGRHALLAAAGATEPRLLHVSTADLLGSAVEDAPQLARGTSPHVAVPVELDAADAAELACGCARHQPEGERAGEAEAIDLIAARVAQAIAAAFIATHERRPLRHDHLLRAVALVYRELGRLAADGKLD